MFRSLHRKLVLILVLLIVSVMAVVGTFLINSVSTFYLQKFYEQVDNAFSTDTISSLQNSAKSGGAKEIQDVLIANANTLGINSTYRNYYVLDGDGQYIPGTGSNETIGGELARTANVIAAMTGEVGDRSSVSDASMDIAIPIDAGQDGKVDYIIYIVDDKREISDLSWKFFQIVMQAMMFGLLAAILLSFLLSKTITTPIENITEGARNIADGRFNQRLAIESSDEIGELTRSFNYMARKLDSTIGEVQSERDKLSTLFLHMTDGVAAFKTNGELIHMNPAMETLLGVRFEQNFTFDELLSDVDMPQNDETVARSFVTSEIRRFGRILSVTLAPYGIIENEGGVIAVLRDVTEQRKLDETRREFVANVSHELRTPLTNIQSYTETLLDADGELPAETEKQFLGVISNESERMARIVTDLLTLSKMDYGRMDLKMSRFEIGDMLQNVGNAMLLTAQERGHKLTIHAPENLPKIMGDKERLEQVIVNIVSNSVKYTASGGNIAVAAKLIENANVQITVTDNGIGIPKEDVPRLFERFYRVDKARSREAGGTGLGLAIAKEIVEQHKGNIALESEYGKGTTVTITLPTVQDTAGGDKA